MFSCRQLSVISISRRLGGKLASTSSLSIFCANHGSRNWTGEMLTDSVSLGFQPRASLQRLADQAFGKLRDQADFFGDRDEDFGADHPERRRIPAREHFEPGQLAGRQVDLLLVIGHELASWDAAADSASSSLRNLSSLSMPDRTTGGSCGRASWPDTSRYRPCAAGSGRRFRHCRRCGSGRPRWSFPPRCRRTAQGGQPVRSSVRPGGRPVRAGRIERNDAGEFVAANPRQQCFGRAVLRASGGLFRAACASPAAWPLISLTCLKLSRSSMTKATASPRLPALAIRAWVAGPIERRLRQPVSASVSARMRACSSALRRSAIRRSARDSAASRR